MHVMDLFAKVSADSLRLFDKWWLWLLVKTRAIPSVAFGCRLGVARGSKLQMARKW